MTLALSANLPLRTSAVWGEFGEVAVIHHRYGRTRGPAIRYDSTGRRYVWADHASELLTAVWIDGQPSSAWTWRNVSDVTGHAVTLIELSQSTTGVVTAAGYGKINANTGALIDDPAEIIADILTNVVGRDAPNVGWLGFEAARLGIACAGSLDDDQQSVQSAISAIAESIGAIWSARAREFARIAPGGQYDGGSAAAESGPTFHVGYLRNAKTSIDSIVNVVVVEFDHDGSTARQTLEMDVPDSVARFGRREQRIEARWIADGRVAAALATRLLTYRSEPSWLYSAEGVPGDVRTLSVVHWTGDTDLPAPESAIVLSARYDPATRSSAIEFERLTATGAELRLVRQGSAIVDDALVQAQVQTQGDQRRIQLKGEGGNPLPRAKVILDGTIIRYSDAGGWVVFPVQATPSGIHTLAITDEAGNSTTLSLLIQ